MSDSHGPVRRICIGRRKATWRNELTEATEMSSKTTQILRLAVVSFVLTISIVSPPPRAQEPQGESAMQKPEPTSSGYAEAAEGLRIYYETYGRGEPIVVLAGGLMSIRTTAQITRSL
jgi:hypothetical protein